MFSIETLREEQTAFDVSLSVERNAVFEQQKVIDEKKPVLTALTSAAEKDFEAIKVLSKEIKDLQKKVDIEVENIEKKVDKFRRDQLTKIGCIPNNHPETHDAVRHLETKAALYESHQEILSQYVAK